MRCTTVMFPNTAMTHSTGAILSNNAPMMIKTMRSGRSRKPTLQVGMMFARVRV